MNATQATEFLYEWHMDHDDSRVPDEWRAYRILKKTKKCVFVEYTYGGPWHKTMRLDRAKLEAEGGVYWHDGTWCVHFQTEEGKRQYDLKRAEWSAYIPDCLKVLGLTREATVEDVKRAYHEAALKEHPDTGGTHEGFLNLQEYYQLALRMVQP